MSALSGHVEDYLRLRRALGFKAERAGQLLPQLVAYLEEAGLSDDDQRAGDRVGAAAAEAHNPTTGRSGWPSPAGSPHYLQTIDPATEVPPAGVFPSRRAPPDPLPVVCQRHLPAARRSAGAAPAVAGGDSRDAVRTARRLRACGLGRRLGSSATTSTSVAGVDHDPGGEVRPLPAGAAAPDDNRGAAPLRGRA